MQFLGQGTPVIAQASSGVDLHVHPDCDQNNACDIADAICGGSISNAVAWTAAIGVDYPLLLTLSEFSARTSMREFEPQIVGNNNFCEGAQPVVCCDAAIIASVENATQQNVILCEDINPFSDSQPGLWCNVGGGVSRVCGFLHVSSSCSLLAFSQHTVPWARHACHCPSKWWR